MPGYDRKRIVGLSSTELDEFICGICLEVFNKPIVAKCCGQTFCNDCITEWLIYNTVCPYDRKQCIKSQLITAPKIVTNLLHNMQIKCEYNERGCQTVIRLGDLEKHQANCKFNPVCGNCGLSNSNHSKEECIAELVEKINKLQTTESTRYPASIHLDVICDGCDASDFSGIRYKCTTCLDYDLCENCELTTGIHPADHEMIKIKLPRREPSAVYNRDGDVSRRGSELNRNGGDTLLKPAQLYYCGKMKNECRCRMCDGRCGPNSGCPCNSCLELIRNRAGDLVWRGGQRGGTGGGTNRRPSELYYCGKRKNECRCGGCDGTCGPTNGCPCNLCLELVH